MNIPIYSKIANYFYTINCFKAIKNDETINRVNKFKMSRFNVLYTFVKIDKDIPKEYTRQVIASRMALVDEAMYSMNLDGLVDTEIKKIPNPIDSEGQIIDENFDYFGVEFRPLNSKIVKFYIFLLILICCFLAIYTKNHFSEIKGFLSDIYGKIISR